MIQGFNEKGDISVPQKVEKTGAFSPRSIQKLVNTNRPKLYLDIECQHMLREPEYKSKTNKPTLSHLLWLEIGKHGAPYPEKPDLQYNSTTWRNFRKAYGLGLDTEEFPSSPRVTEAVAKLCPLRIPMPSQLGKNTYTHYLTYNTKVIGDPELRKKLIKSTDLDVRRFRAEKLKSEMRNPPIDKFGEILPPKNYRKFEPVVIHVDSKEPTKELHYIDSMGQRIPYSKHKPHVAPSRLLFQKNQPHYDRLLEEFNERKTKKATTSAKNKPKYFPPPFLNK